MDTAQETLLELIKQSQFGTKAIIHLNTDWDEVYNEASMQSVLGLVAPEVPSENISDERWQQAQYRQMASYIRYNHAESKLVQLMRDSSISFVILKGNSAAINYTTPSRRSMGDIDFILYPIDIERAKDIFLKNGYNVNSDIEGNTRHISFSKDGIEFEMHRSFSYEDLSIDDFIMKGIEDNDIGSIDDHTFPMLPRLANGLVLLLHMRQHFRSGLGLRQVIDWMMYVNNHLDDDCWNNEFSQVAKEKGMNTLAMVVTRMCQIYLGLPNNKFNWCKEVDEKTCELLMEDILESGNFGRKKGQGFAVEAVSTSIKRKGLFSWLQHAGEYNWKAYHKHNWLKPFCWIYQIFRYAKQGFKSGRNKKQLSEDLGRSEKRYELLKKLGIE